MVGPDNDYCPGYTWSTSEAFLVRWPRLGAASVEAAALTRSGVFSALEHS
jgi:hypothetical protein